MITHYCIFTNKTIISGQNHDDRGDMRSKKKYIGKTKTMFMTAFDKQVYMREDWSPNWPAKGSRREL
jgi:hypothetical protein